MISLRQQIDMYLSLNIRNCAFLRKQDSQVSGIRYLAANDHNYRHNRNRQYHSHYTPEHTPECQGNNNTDRTEIGASAHYHGLYEVPYYDLDDLHGREHINKLYQFPGGDHCKYSREE